MPAFLVRIFAMATVLLCSAFATEATAAETPAPTRSGYVRVHGLSMYFERHGKGEPLLLLHGAFSATGTSFGRLLPGLSRSHEAIAVELQGHGRTADIDRPITYEQMADDVAALLTELKLERTDVCGYSLGAGVALQLALRHPAKVRKLVLISPAYKTSGIYEEVWAGMPNLAPEVFEGTPFKQEYDALAPNRSDWPRLVAKLKKLDTTTFNWGESAVRSINKPALIVIGDADIVRPEHAAEMLRLFGGGVVGDMSGLPPARLAVLPGTTHLTVVERAAFLVPMITEFLGAESTKSPPHGPSAK